MTPYLQLTLNDPHFEKIELKLERAIWTKISTWHAFILNTNLSAPIQNCPNFLHCVHAVHQTTLFYNKFSPLPLKAVRNRYITFIYEWPPPPPGSKAAQCGIFTPRWLCSLRLRSHRGISYTVFAIRYMICSQNRRDSVPSSLHHLNVVCGREATTPWTEMRGNIFSNIPAL